MTQVLPRTTGEYCWVPANTNIARVNRAPCLLPVFAFRAACLYTMPSAKPFHCYTLGGLRSWAKYCSSWFVGNCSWVLQSVHPPLAPLQCGLTTNPLSHAIPQGAWVSRDVDVRLYPKRFYLMLRRHRFDCTTGYSQWLEQSVLWDCHLQHC